MKLTDQRIVITGAGSGIGRALLDQLQAVAGVKIIAADIDVRTIVPAAHVLVLACDLSEPEGTDVIMNKALEWMGGIDLYFANAGFAYYEQLGPANWTRLQRIYSTNVLTPIYSFQRVRELAQGQAFRVVITASAMGYLPIPGYAVYGATKASLISFVQALRWELDDPCSLTLLNPIATRTRFFEQEHATAPTPFPSQTPEHVARRVIRAIKADKKDVFPSLIFRLTLLANRILPWVGWIYQKQQQLILKGWSASSKSEKPPQLNKSA